MIDLTVSPDLYKNDALIGNSCEEPVVIVGEHALACNGLTTALCSTKQLSTLYTGIDGIINPICGWYFSPWADRYEHTRPSPKHEKILIPTRERALWEYMMLHEKFDEGILIEGLSDYLRLTENAEDKLLEEARYWGCGEEDVKYWINEAINDYEV